MMKKIFANGVWRKWQKDREYLSSYVLSLTRYSSAHCVQSVTQSYELRVKWGVEGWMDTLTIRHYLIRPRWACSSVPVCTAEGCCWHGKGRKGGWKGASKGRADRVRVGCFAPLNRRKESQGMEETEHSQYLLVLQYNSRV